MSSNLESNKAEASRYFLSFILLFLHLSLSSVTHSVSITHSPGPKQAFLVCSSPQALTLSLATTPLSRCLSPSPSFPGSVFLLLFFFSLCLSLTVFFTHFSIYFTLSVSVFSLSASSILCLWALIELIRFYDIVRAAEHTLMLYVLFGAQTFFRRYLLHTLHNLLPFKPLSIPPSLPPTVFHAL